MGKRLLALDLGGSCGWFCLIPDEPAVFGTMDLTPNRFEGGGMRYLRFQQELSKLQEAYAPDIVVFEEVRRHLSAASATAYGAYKAFLMVWCETHSVPYTSVPVGTWKKALCGQGNASKELVKACIKRLGFDVKTFDEADAAGIALFAEKEFG